MNSSESSQPSSTTTSTGPIGVYNSPASSTTSITSPDVQNGGLKPGEPGFKNPHDKKGRSTSCLLCQKRKQKCDHRLPSCTTCIKAGVRCVQPAKYAVKAPSKDEYTIMMEKKVKFLEKILDINNISIDEHGNPNVKKNFKYKKFSPFIAYDDALPNVTQNNFHQLNNRQLPMLPNETKQNNSLALSLESIDYSNSILAKYDIVEFTQFDPVFEVDEKYSRAFLDIYFTRLQFKYPLLDEEEVFEFHNAYVTNNNLTAYMKDIGFFHYCCARMWMIYAISSCLQMTTGKYRGPQPERFFSTAIRHVSKCGELSDLQRCELLTLTVLYLIRTDRDSVCLYEIIKDSLEICARLGLNRSQTYWTLLPKDRNKRVRIWWCNYLLERMICIAVGKSHSLDENLVDPDLPLFEFEHSKSVKHPNNINFINQSIKLRRIESRFVQDLNIIANSTNIDKPIPKVEKFFQELEIWRGNCEVFSNGIENETLRLYYYRSVRLLIQPFLELMDPMDKLFMECQAAAGHICQLFKVFHQKTVSGHSTTAIHTVFSAGVTLIYCLWLTRNKDDLKRKQLGDHSKHTRPTVSKRLFNGLNDLRSCSICLYVMAERSKFALMFRDTFDQLMTATINNLIERCGPDASEIIYSNEPGMPPAAVRKLTDTYHQTGFGFDNGTSSEDKIEQAERRRRQGQLQKTVVPKSLSHLLIPVHEDSTEPPAKKQKFGDLKDSSIPHDEVNLNSFQYPTSLESSLQQQQQQEISLFNGRTNKMINNISVWTGESGGLPITTSLFEQNNYTTAPKNKGNSSAPAHKNNNVNYLWNVPVEEFWKNNDDYGFLA